MTSRLIDSQTTPAPASTPVKQDTTNNEANKSMGKAKQNTYPLYWRKLIIFITFLADIGALLTAGFSTFALLEYFGYVNLTLGNSTMYTVGFTGAFILLAMVLGIYRQGYYSDTNHQYLLASKTYIFGTALLMAMLYVTHLYTVPRRFTLLFLLLLPPHFIVFRQLIQLLITLMRRRRLGVYNTLLIMNGDSLEDLALWLGHFRDFGYTIKGVIRTANIQNNSHRFEIDRESPPIYTMNELDDVITKNDIHRIFITSNNFIVSGIDRLAALCYQHNIKLKVISRETYKLLRMAKVYDLAGVTIVSSASPFLGNFRRCIKRTTDFLGALLLLLILSPVFIITSCLIFLESGWPVIYKQKRSTLKDGKVFNFYKFRSMQKDADTLRDTLDIHNEADGALFKMKDDPRVTRIGRFIRKYSIDELPQLLNVLKGDMSLVGPRPLPVSDFEQSNLDGNLWHIVKDRAAVRPGITGLWQISGRSDIPFVQMVLLDLYYIEHHSLLFDVEILFETIPAVLFGRGAY